METDGNGLGASGAAADGAPAAPMGPGGWADEQGAYATVLRLYARTHPRGAAVAAASAVGGGGGGPQASEPCADDSANSEASPTEAYGPPLLAEAADEGWLRTLWAAFGHEMAAGAGLLPAVGAVLAAAPALAPRMVEWECRAIRDWRPQDPDAAGGGQDTGGGVDGGGGGVAGAHRLALFLPYALAHTGGGAAAPSPSPPPPPHPAAGLGRAAGLVRAAASIFVEGGDSTPWPLLAPFLRAAVRARYGGADEGSDGARSVLRAALRSLTATAAGREGEEGGARAAAWRCLVGALGAEGGGGVNPVTEAVRLLRALPAGWRRRVLEVGRKG